MNANILKSASARLKDWTVQAALPFWAERGRDEQGGWYEHFILDGTPDKTAIRRHRIQARQTYVYAKATQAGWFDGDAVARSSYDFMCRYGEGQDGKPGLIHRLNPDLSVADNKRDFYDHAFYLLACASLYALTRAPQYLAKAQEILAFIDGLKSPRGGWAEGHPHSLPRRQNPHMHLLEASLALHSASGIRAHLNYADQVFSLFKHYFYDAGHNRIREFFKPDWTLASGVEGQTAEPGHAVEWIWLLSQYEKASGIKTEQFRKELYETAFEQSSVFLNDEEDLSGDVRRESKRLWVQTEVIKSHLTMAEHTVPGSAELAANAIEGLFLYYLNADGTWIDQINACNTPMAKTIPVSTFYHIICMALEAERVSNALSA